MKFKILLAFLVLTVGSYSIAAEKWYLKYDDWTCYAGTYVDPTLPPSNSPDWEENASYCDIQKNFNFLKYDEFYSIVMHFKQCNFEEDNEDFELRVSKYLPTAKKSERNYYNLKTHSKPVHDMAYRVRFIPDKARLSGDDINSSDGDKAQFLRLVTEQTAMSISIGKGKIEKFDLSGVKKAIKGKCVTY